MKILFIDDDYIRYQTLRAANPRTEIVWVQCVPAALQCLTEDTFDLVMFDHDLGIFTPNGSLADQDGVEVTTMPIAQRLSFGMYMGKDLNLFMVKMFLIHSANPVGVMNLLNCLSPISEQFSIDLVADPRGFMKTFKINGNKKVVF